MISLKDFDYSLEKGIVSTGAEGTYSSTKRIAFIHKIDEQIILTEEYKQFIRELSQIVEISNLENHVLIFIKNLCSSYLRELNINEGLLRVFVKELMREPIKIQAYAELTGLTLEPESVQINSEIKIRRPFHKNLVSEIRKNPKIYFVDTGLRNFIVDRFDFSDEETGRILENYTLNALGEEKINYWRTTAKAEVDFILANKLIPIEVKINPKLTRSLRSFIHEYKPQKGILVNMNSSYKTKVENTDVFVVPAGLI